MTQHSNNKLLRIFSHFHLKGLDRTQPPLCGGGGGGDSQCAANLVSRVSLSDIRPSPVSECARVGWQVRMSWLEGAAGGQDSPLQLLLGSWAWIA